MTDFITFKSCEELSNGDQLHTFMYSGKAYNIIKKQAIKEYKEGSLTKVDIERFGPTKDCRRTENKIAAWLGKEMLKHVEEENDEPK